VIVILFFRTELSVYVFAIKFPLRIFYIEKFLVSARPLICVGGNCDGFAAAFLQTSWPARRGEFAVATALCRRSIRTPRQPPARQSASAAAAVRILSFEFRIFPLTV
jgi:hypothetical protein